MDILDDASDVTSRFVASPVSDGAAIGTVVLHAKAPAAEVKEEVQYSTTALFPDDRRDAGFSGSAVTRAAKIRKP